ncbi:MerR family transcriptional regulator [Pseudobutyrivibrio sp.]|uniref:MerR family transcriptional regulator n=1 Tax=Pseudobutyrivibrio sp. TaxID=2014367 RepID=UPI002600B8FA|nr:MerR family transcriptional regulator [Pseudobutyrivibrio sp.]MBR5648808.1 MerR family transcriptional regulator [Pseudobutyrivibrio sp.]
MKIGEVSEALGISVSNIRFYEKKGLIGPDRDKESKYRNYSDEDINELKQIIVLRKMGVTIETITDVLNEDISISEAISSQLDSLDEEEKRINASRELCKKAMSEVRKNPNELVSLFDYVGEEEKLGVKFPVIDELVDGVSKYVDVDSFILSLPFGGYLYTNTRFKRIATMAIVLWLAVLIGLVIYLIITRK